MKKFTAFALAFILGLSLTACNSGTSPSGGQDIPSGSPDSTPKAQEISLSGEVNGEITVYCYDTMTYKSFLEEAGRLFEEKYPGTKVNIETFSAMPEIKTAEEDGKKMSMIQVQDDPQGRTDYINKVSTGLMSGGGADILAMDVLPVHKYADGGQLVDLGAYINADASFDADAYRGNILDAIQYRGGTWFLPVDYTFYYYAYDSTLISGDAASAFGTGSAFSTEQLVEIANPLFDGSSKLFNSPDYMKGPGGGMFAKLLDESYASFVDLQNKKANFADGSFVALLNAVKEYSELGYIPKGVTMQGAGGQGDAGAIMRRAEEAPTERYFYKTKNNFSLAQQFSRDSGRRMMIMTGGALAGIEDDDEVAGIAADKNGNVPFEYQQAYGINANSQNKETAWAFIKFLLSEEMQLSTSLSPMSVPLLNSAREKKAELVLSGAFMGRGEPMDDAQREVLRKYLEAEEKLADQINAFKMKDTTVDDMIASEAAYFFDGTKTAGEVADVLQSKVDLYLNE